MPTLLDATPAPTLLPPGAFLGLEREAFAAEVEDLAQRRAEWLQLRPSAERSALGVPMSIDDSHPMSFGVG